MMGKPRAANGAADQQNKWHHMARTREERADAADGAQRPRTARRRFKCDARECGCGRHSATTVALYPSIDHCGNVSRTTTCTVAFQSSTRISAVLSHVS